MYTIQNPARLPGFLLLNHNSINPRVTGKQLFISLKMQQDYYSRKGAKHAKKALFFLACFAPLREKY
ncbi:MAG: hypothetical protein BMS9Abin19_0059 [Gammaproteobacteria bacterium]|nr:MAG: hypothetical protein BMS9Abin19_0059 [Gammaproteobacteria bacterium]